MPFYGEKPAEATFYARQERMEIVAWTPPPPPGDELCQALTGKTENQLVRDILDGRYNHILEKEETHEKIHL